VQRAWIAEVVYAMAMPNPYRAYVETEVSTASPGRLVLMLYNGALRFISEAKAGITQGRIQDAHNKITRAADIVNELRLSLDKEAGGEIARNLDRLYDFVDYKLMMANVHKNAEELAEAVGILTDIRDAWAAIVASEKVGPVR
jgi:flagellar protein FliS